MNYFKPTTALEIYILCREDVTSIHEKTKNIQTHYKNLWYIYNAQQNYVIQVLVSFMYGPAKRTTLSDGKHKRNPRVVVTKVITNAGNATW